MAGWYKQHTSELASLEAFAQCGRIDVVTSWLRVTRWTVDHESDDLPRELLDDAAKLESVGIRITFSSRCKKLLDQREAMAAKRELKRAQVNSSELTSAHVSSCDHQDKTIQDKTRQEREERVQGEDAPAAPAKAPRKKREPSPSFDLWVPKDDHQAIAKERGLDLEAERQAMADWLKAEGKTKKDYDAFARNWLRRATPKRASPASAMKSGDRANWAQLNANNQAAFREQVAKYQRWSAPLPPPTPEEEAELDRIFKS